MEVADTEAADTEAVTLVGATSAAVTSAEANSVEATSVRATSRVGSPAGPFVKEDSIATSACLVGYLVTAAAPTVTHTRLTAPTATATTIAIDTRGPMGEADVGLTHQADGTHQLSFNPP